MPKEYCLGKFNHDDNGTKKKKNISTIIKSLNDNSIIELQSQLINLNNDPIEVY